MSHYNNPDYSPSYLKKIRAAAMKIKGAVAVCHIRPRSYCIAKPAACCAVFVTPRCDAEPLVKHHENATSQIIHEGVEDVRVGDWCVLAYVVTPMASGTRVIKL